MSGNVTPDDIRNLRPGDQVRFECCPSKLETVSKVRDLSSRGHICFSIDCTNGIGHGGCIPIEIIKAGAQSQACRDQAPEDRGVIVSYTYRIEHVPNGYVVRAEAVGVITHLCKKHPGSTFVEE